MVGFITPRPSLLKYVLDDCHPGGVVWGQLFSLYLAVSTVLASLSCGTQTSSCGRGRRISEERTHGSAWCSECTSLNPTERCCRCRLPLSLWSAVSVNLQALSRVHTQTHTHTHTEARTHPNIFIQKTSTHRKAHTQTFPHKLSSLPSGNLGCWFNLLFTLIKNHFR